ELRRIIAGIRNVTQPGDVGPPEVTPERERGGELRVDFARPEMEKTVTRATRERLRDAIELLACALCRAARLVDSSRRNRTRRFDSNATSGSQDRLERKIEAVALRCLPLSLHHLHRRHLESQPMPRLHREVSGHARPKVGCVGSP